MFKITTAGGETLRECMTDANAIVTAYVVVGSRSSALALLRNLGVGKTVGIAPFYRVTRVA